jgi:hypothetical protein
MRSKATVEGMMPLRPMSFGRACNKKKMQGCVYFLFISWFGHPVGFVWGPASTVSVGL